MRSAKIVLFGAIIAIVALSFLGYHYFDVVGPICDRYGNLASVMGLLVALIGFPLTVWSVIESQRAAVEAQSRIEREVGAAKRETHLLFAKIRLKSLNDACEQAIFVTGAARSAIRFSTWPQAAERVQEARQLVLRLLNHPGVTEDERQSIRDAAEDLTTLEAFIERNRLWKHNAPAGLPAEKVAPLESLLDGLETLRARLHQQFLEIPDVD